MGSVRESFCLDGYTTLLVSPDQKVFQVLSSPIVKYEFLVV